MSKKKILDCTLRDGAYLVDKDFGEETKISIIASLVEVGIDIIEVGFLQDEGFGIGKTIYKNSEDIKKILPLNKKTSKFSAFCDFGRYSIKNLDKYSEGSVQYIRACFQKQDRFRAIDFCKSIQDKGYQLFIQPVDIMGYTDKELLEYIELVNTLEPYCFSIVDTFGSMYLDDLQHVFSLVHKNLIERTGIGFHSHNNLQLSSALSQSFFYMQSGQRELIVDSTVFGMGRGAGNTPTELIVEYMVKKQGSHYNMDALLDLADAYIEPLKRKVKWGYDLKLFLAGSYSSHVNNIFYLCEKGSIRSKDIRYILNSLGNHERKHYNYANLERNYFDHMNSDIDDSYVYRELEGKLKGKRVLILAPGNSVEREKRKIIAFKKKTDALVISINFIPEFMTVDYVYVSNVKRFISRRNNIFSENNRIIVTSNVSEELDNLENAYVVSFQTLIKAGWEHMDNSTILLLRLLDNIQVSEVVLAGLDGYRVDILGENYVKSSMELFFSQDQAILLNGEITSMLEDFMATKKYIKTVSFLTKSRFEGAI